MTGRERLLTASSAVAVVVLLLTATGVTDVWVRLLAGLPLVVLLPGYGLVSALFPDASLGRLERFALAVGVSFSLTIVLGLAAAASPNGLDRPMWAFVLAGFALLANAVAVLRLRRVAPAEVRPLVTARPTTLGLGLTATAFVVLLLVFSAGRTGRPSNGEIVQLWATPQSGTSGRVVLIGASNLLSPTSLFRLRVFQGDDLLAEKTLDLPAGGSTSLPVRPTDGGSRMTPVTAILTGIGGPTTERTVIVWPSATTTSTVRPR